MPCSDCKHWDAKDNENGYDVPKGVRECHRAVEIWEVTEWAKEGDDEDAYTERRVKAEYRDQKMFAADGSSYSASFLTRGDFHCSEYEPSK